MSHAGELSYLPLDNPRIETGYELVGVAGSAATAWLGIPRQWNDVANLGNTFFVIFLYTKLFDWCWA